MLEDEAPPLNDSFRRKWMKAATLGEFESPDYTDYHTRINEIDSMVKVKADQLFKKWKDTGLYGSPDKKFLEAFTQKLLRSPGAYELFCTLSATRQEEFMKISSIFNAEMFHTYILLAESLQMKELIVLERKLDRSELPNAIHPASNKQIAILDVKAALAGNFTNFKKFFKVTRGTIRSRYAIDDVTEDFKKFTISVASEVSYSSSSIALFTMLYLFRELFSEKVLFEYYERANSDSVVTSPVKIFYILKDWDNLKDQPLIWTVNVVDTMEEIEV